MKELEVKAMLADPNIPDSYKLGGRLDERFLAGIEYAEATMEKAPTVWVAKDRDGKYFSGWTHLFLNKPERSEEQGCFFIIDKDGKYDIFNDIFNMINLTNITIHGLTWENSPRKVRLILEDEQ
jgi:hypothetical protein